MEKAYLFKYILIKSNERLFVNYIKNIKKILKGCDNFKYDGYWKNGFQEGKGVLILKLK